MNQMITREAVTKNAKRDAGFFIRRIGHTEYRVGVHFSDKNTETARDKIMRLVRYDTQTEAQQEERVTQ